MNMLRGLGLMAGLALACLAGLVPAKARADGLVVSNLTSFCMDAQGGSNAAGTPIIMYWCTGAWNQTIQFTGAGEMRIGGRCLDAAGGTRQGAQIILWDCHGGANQKWQIQGDRVTQGGLCIDVWGAVPAPWIGVQLWPCHGGSNQSWRGGRLAAATSLGIDPNQANAAFQQGVSGNKAAIVAAGGGNIVAAGGGNIVAAGGGNIVAAGGGNVIVTGGNIVAGGAGN